MQLGSFMSKVWEFIARRFFKDNNKALTIGLTILNAMDGVIEESADCDGQEVKLFPIYVKRGGRKWTINVTIKCEKES